MPTISESLYEQLFPLTTVMGQRVVENFSGDSLNERWTETLVGSGSSGINDTVNGGAFLTTGATVNNSTTLSFNDIKQYDDSACVMIFVASRDDTAGGRYDFGLQDGVDKAFWRNNANDSFYRLNTNDGAIGSSTASSISVDTAIFRVLKIEMKATSAEGTIDGILEATQSSNLPDTGQLEPELKCTHNNSVAATSDIRYLEIYNT